MSDKNLPQIIFNLPDDVDAAYKDYATTLAERLSAIELSDDERKNIENARFFSTSTR